MNTLPLALRRAVAQSGLLFTVFAVTVVVSGVLVGVAGYLDLSVTTAARSVAARAAPDAAAARIEIKANDPQGQATTLAELLEPRFAGTTATIDHSLAIYPLATARASDSPDEPGTPVTVPDGNAEAWLHVVADASLPSRTQLTSGEWPAAGEAALNDAAASLLGIRVGDVLEVGDPRRTVALTVSGLWTPLDASDPYWMNDPGIATGEGYPAGNGTRAFGPLAVDEPTLFSFGITPTAWWTIVPDVETITPLEWERLDRALTGLRDEVRTLPNSHGAASIVSGGLAATTGQVLTGLGAIRGVTPVGLVLVGVLGLVTLVQLARLLSLARRPETALLRSRGASAAWLTLASFGEAFVVAALGSGLGLAAASAALHGMFGSEASSTLPWPFAGAVAITVLAVLTAIAWRESARVSRRDTVDDSGRARDVTTMAATVLALAAAGVATWQSLLYGSPLVTDASGRLSVNPLAVLAPALCLIAGALVVLLLLGPLSRVVEAAVVRARRLQPAYSVRQVARGLVGYAAAILVIALASGGVVVAAGYAGSWNGLSERTAQLVSGADVRVMLPESHIDAVDHAKPLDEYRDVPGVASASRVFSLTVNVGDNAELIALPAENLDVLATASGGAIDGEELAALLSPTEPPGVPLPPDTTALSVDVEYGAPRWPYPPEYPQELIDLRSSRTITIGSEVWLQDAVGTLVRVALGSEEVTTDGETYPRTYVVDVPDGVAPWTLEGFDSHTGPTGFGDALITFSNVRTVGSAPGAEGTPVEIDFRDWSQWFSDSFQYGIGTGGFSNSETTVTSRIGTELRGATARVATGGNGAGWFRPFAQMPAIPIVIDERLAEHLDIAIGDDIVLGARSYSIGGRVVGLVPFVPGTNTPFAIVADLSTLNVEFIRSINPISLPNEVWVASDGSRPLTDIATDLANVAPAGATVTTVDDLRQTTFPRPAELSLWIAAAASLALATISLGAVTLTVARSRRGEVGVLRAVGVHAAAQSRARFGEVALVLVTAIVAGCLMGWGVSALTVPGLAHSVVVGAPEGLETGLQFAWREGLALLGLAAAAMIAIALAYAMRVRAQALNTDERLETR